MKSSILFAAILIACATPAAAQTVFYTDSLSIASCIGCAENDKWRFSDKLPSLLKFTMQGNVIMISNQKEQVLRLTDRKDTTYDKYGSSVNWWAKDTDDRLCIVKFVTDNQYNRSVTIFYGEEAYTYYLAKDQTKYSNR